MRGVRAAGVAAIALAVAATLVVVGKADAHVTADPPFFRTGTTAALGLIGPNERDEPMNAFSVTAPDGLRIAHAHADGWTATVESGSATWVGGSLEPESEARFEIVLDVTRDPGATGLEAEQRYPGGEVVRWTVPITVLPASDTPGQQLGWALVVGLVGLGVAASAVFMAWRRSPR